MQEIKNETANKINELENEKEELNNIKVDYNNLKIDSKGRNGHFNSQIKPSLYAKKRKL